MAVVVVVYGVVPTVHGAGTGGRPAWKAVPRQRRARVRSVSLPSFTGSRARAYPLRQR